MRDDGKNPAYVKFTHLSCTMARGESFQGTGLGEGQMQRVNTRSWRARQSMWCGLAGLTGLMLTIIVPLLSVQAAQAPTSFPVDAAFDSFVRQLGPDLIGSTISPPLMHDGTRMQYYERARLDLPLAKPVELAKAGTLLANGLDTARIQPTVNDRTRYFADTGHSIGGSFRAFWEAHSGATTFGLPVTEEFAERNPLDGMTRTVQYFERVRLEWHPELIATVSDVHPEAVRLGTIGRQLWQFVEGVRLPGATDTPVLGLTTPGKPPMGLVVEFTNQPRDVLERYVMDLGMKWVRQPVQWNGIESVQGYYDFAGLDLTVNDLRTQGINILFTVSGSPGWATANGDHGAPRDNADFARFMGALAKHYIGRVQAYEVWNEPNLAIEWGGRVDAGAYVEMLKAVSPAIRGADFGALVIAAALGPTGVMDAKLGIDDVKYLEQLETYQNGIYRTLADVQGSHPYGYRSAPDLLPPGKPNIGSYTNHPSFYFRRIEQQRLAMIRNGDGDRAMWITEWGFGSGDYVEFSDVTEAMRTQWTVDSVQMIRSQYPWVGAMFLWNLNWSVFSPTTTSWGYFSLIDNAYTPKPVYYAIRNIPK